MDALIASGEVRVNGLVATPGTRVEDHDMIQVGHRRIRVKAEVVEAPPRVLIYHKPEGEIVSRDDPEGRPSVFKQLPKLKGQRWIAIGRLDFNTSGLLVFTTSGTLANRIAHPRFEVEREYAVRILGQMSEEQMETSTREILLEDGPAYFDRIEDRGGEGANHWYQVILREGRNREVRRMFEAMGYTVSRLMRVRFGLIDLPPRLKRGQSLELTAAQTAKVVQWAGLKRSEGTSEESQTRTSRHPSNRAK